MVGGYSRPFGTLGHANFLAGYLAMTWPLAAVAAGRAFRQGRWAAGGLAGATAVLGGSSVALSLSRGGWAALAAAVLVLAAALGGGTPRRRLALLLGLLALAAAAVPAAQHLERRPGVLGAAAGRVTHLADVGARGPIWETALCLFADRPLLGWGLDTFALTLTRYRTPAYWELEWNCTPARAHSEPVQVLVTQGLVGAAAVLYLAVALALGGRRAWRRAGPEDRPLVAAVLAGMAAFSIQALFSFTVAACGALFVTLAALLSRWAEGVAPGRTAVGALAPRGPRRRWLAAVPPALGAALVLAAGYRAVAAVKAEVACRRGQEVLGTDPVGAVRHFTEAAAQDPGDDRHWLLLAAAQAAAANPPWTAPGGEVGRLRHAEEALRRAVALVPASAENQANLGRVLGELALRGSAAAEAFARLDRALTLDPANPLLLCDAAQLAVRLNDWPRVERYAATCHRLYPGYGPAVGQLALVALHQRRWERARVLLALAAAGDWKDDWGGPSRARALLDRVEGLAQGTAAARR